MVMMTRRVSDGDYGRENISTTTSLFNGPGTVFKVVVVSTGSSVSSIIDSAGATALAANTILTIPAGAAVGTSYTLNWPCFSGLCVLPGSGAILSITYSNTVDTMTTVIDPITQTAIDFDFTTGVLPGIITVARAGNTATYFDSTGTMQGTTANSARYDYNPATKRCNGLLIEENRTNSIKNSTMVGAVAGSPGTLPTGWTSVLSGLTQTVVGTGTENGISYIDLRFNGTTSGTSFLVNFGAATDIAAANGQIWTQSFYLKLTAGSLTNVTSVQMIQQFYDITPTFLSAATQNITPIAGPGLAQQRYVFTNTIAQANTAYNLPYIKFNCGNPVAIDVTFRIGGVQLENASTSQSGVTSFIPTTNAAVARNAETFFVTSIPWFNASAGTMDAEFIIANRATVVAGVVPVAMQFDDGTTNNLIALRLPGTGTQEALSVFIANATTGGVNASGGWVQGAINKFAANYSTTVEAVLNNNAIASASQSALPTGLNRLQIGTGRTVPITGYMRRVRYWPQVLADSQMTQIAALNLTEDVTFDLDFTQAATYTSLLLNFTRATSATYVNSSGLIATTPINLFLQSGDLTNGTSLSNVTVVANSGTAPDGSPAMTRVVETAATGVHSVFRTGITVVVSTTYTYSIYLQAQQDSFAQLFLDDTTNRVYATFNLSNGTISQAVAATGTAVAVGAAIQAIGNGIYRCSITGQVSATTGRAGIYLATSGTPGLAPSYAGNTSNGLLAWGGQLELGSSPSNYMPTTSTVNSQPRLDYDPIALTPRGFLCEEARTNLFLQSSDLSTLNTNASPGDVARTGASGTSPDGANTAALLVPSTANGTHLAWKAFTGATSTTYTWSVYFKAAGYSFVQLNLSNSGFSANSYAAFNVSTGQLLSTGAGAVSGGIAAAGNGWYRCWVVATSVSSAGTYVAGITPYNGGGFAFAGDGVSGLLAWGGQVEAGVFPTSLIPTTTGSVTRNTDNMLMYSTAWGQPQGTFVTDTVWAAVLPTGNFPRFFEMSDQTITNFLGMTFTPSTTMSLLMTNGGVAQAQANTSVYQPVVGTSFRTAATYTASAHTVSVAGNAVAASQANTAPSAWNTLYIGNRSALDRAFNGHIRRLRYWPRVLTNAELATVTT